MTTPPPRSAFEHRTGGGLIAHPPQSHDTRRTISFLMRKRSSPRCRPRRLSRSCATSSRWTATPRSLRQDQLPHDATVVSSTSTRTGSSRSSPSLRRAAAAHPHRKHLRDDFKFSELGGPGLPLRPRAHAGFVVVPFWIFHKKAGSNRLALAVMLRHRLRSGLAVLPHTVSPLACRFLA